MEKGGLDLGLLYKYSAATYTKVAYINIALLLYMSTNLPKL